MQNPLFTIKAGYTGSGSPRFYMKGYRKIISPRLDPGRGLQYANAISASYEDALYVCVMVAQEYWNRGFGFSHMRIEPFEGLVVR